MSDRYPSDISCPVCSASNDGGAKNVEETQPEDPETLEAEYFCHECEHIWEG